MSEPSVSMMAAPTALRGLTLLPPGTYDVNIIEVHDGDTLWISVPVFLKVRVDHIQAPELSTPKGPASRDFLKGLLASGKAVALVEGAYKFGSDGNGERMVVLTTSDGKDVGAAMIAAGQAVKWDGHGKRPVGTI